SPQINPEWVPPQDPVFNYLIQEAAFGSVPTYFAEIPLARLKRFEPRFRPDTTPAGREVVATIMSNCRAGNVVTMWVYPKGKTFIVADDCFTLAASELGE